MLLVGVVDNPSLKMKYYIIYNFSTILDYGKMTPKEFTTRYNSLKDKYINLNFISFDNEKDYEKFLDRFYSTGLE